MRAARVIRDNSRKFLREASEQDIRVFESLAGSTIDRHGNGSVLEKEAEETLFCGIRASGLRRGKRAVEERHVEKRGPERTGTAGPSGSAAEEIKARQS